ncbi:MAG: hypothetical protein OJF55_000389 [Rhodanobacteraceae bacterium]|nr:MAG: hypothetical protein OJF55_000389 [Rhodanobacteraceae bacterium]
MSKTHWITRGKSIGAENKNPARWPGFVESDEAKTRDCLPGRMTGLRSARARSHPRGRAGAGEDDRLVDNGVCHG